jgi:hypothetical protein
MWKSRIAAKSTHVKHTKPLALTAHWDARVHHTSRQVHSDTAAGTTGLAMFSPDAIYGSSTVGGHQGLDEISNMMAGFFAKFPEVNWQVDDYTISAVRCAISYTGVAQSCFSTGVLCRIAIHDKRPLSSRTSTDWPIALLTLLCALRQESPNCVEFHFVRTGITNSEGQKTQQRGKVPV